MATLAQIRSAIKTKLDTLTGSGQPIAYVYDYYNIKVAGFPAVVFEPERIESDFEDNCNNIRTYTFTLLLMQELKITGREAAVDRLESIFDAILNAFDEDRTLGGLCEGHVLPVGGERDTVEGDNGALVLCTIQLRCKTLYNFS